MTILIIEDEKKLVEILEKALSHERYATDAAYDGEEGLQKALKKSYNLILLDIMLPKMDGMEICAELRKREIQTPIIMLTARGTLEDRVHGLDLGADDYLVKPFEMSELFSRIRAVLRRRKAIESPVLRVDDLMFDHAKHRVVRGGKNIVLTPKEYRILDALMRHSNHPLTRRQLLDEAWGPNFEETNHELNVHVRHLREKIDSGAAKPLIHTIRGVGYVLRE